MSIQSQVNQTLAVTAGGLAIARGEHAKKLLAAKKELDKEKALQMKQSATAEKLAKARLEEQQRMRKQQKADLVKKIKKFYSAPGAYGQTQGEWFAAFDDKLKEESARQFLKENNIKLEDAVNILQDK